ncbi:M1 family metallopeptidase [Lacibacter sp. H407]|uniref:M1 family metallopeptidase n=1 Tax=Lacibacter sp. H407 TaxID=3133423 RepID=UPI0030C08A09
MKISFLLTLLVSAFFTSAQETTYWQQEVNYTIDVSLDVQNKSLKGLERIEYINHSPDTLTYIWFHLWPNAYKDKSTAYAKQNGSTYYRKNNGYIDSVYFTIDNDTVFTEAHPQHIDIIKLVLKQPLLPGEAIRIQTSFFVKIPEYESRLGYAKNDFYISQWYPKPAVYDQKGWHPMPYLDRGEFYSEFGSFDVSITLPSSYVVAATGELTTEEELESYKIIGIKNRKKAGSKYKPAFQSSYKTLRYQQKNIHDFAWFASQDFMIRYSQALLNDGHTVDIFTFSKTTRSSFWDEANDQIADILFDMKEYVGPYPYSSVSVVEGSGNRFSGGMEYPMICLLNVPDAYVLTHEIVHNWFYGIIGSNERDHAWMDEGLTDWFSNTITNRSPVFENDFRDPIDQNAELYKTADAYFFAVYAKTQEWLRLLQKQTGQANFEAGIKEYYSRWKFRHPYPEDFQQVMEQVCKRKLNSVFSLLKERGKL